MIITNTCKCGRLAHAQLGSLIRLTPSANHMKVICNVQVGCRRRLHSRPHSTRRRTRRWHSSSLQHLAVAEKHKTQSPCKSTQSSAGIRDAMIISTNLQVVMVLQIFANKCAEHTYRPMYLHLQKHGHGSDWNSFHLNVRTDISENLNHNQGLSMPSRGEHIW